MNIKKEYLKIVVAVFIVQFFVTNMVQNLLPILQPTLMELHGIDSPDLKTQFSFIYTIGILIPAVGAPIIPKLYDKLGIKLSYIIGIIIAAGGFFAMSIIPQNIQQPQMAIYMLWGLAALFNFGVAMISSIGIPYLLTLWLPIEVKGKMMGIAFMGASIGNVFATFMFKLVNLSTNNLTFLISTLGLSGLAIGLAVAIFIIKKPTEEEMKLIHTSNTNNETKEEKSDIKQVFASKIFLIYVLGLVFLGFYVSAMSTQYPLYFSKEVPNGKELYLLIALTFAICSIAGNFLGGFLFDKIKTLKTIIVAAILAITGIICLILAPQMPNLGYVFGVCYGLSVYAFIVLPGYVTGYLFGETNSNYATILGICQMIFGIGFAVGTVIFSFISNGIGWNLAWMCVLGFAITCYVLLISAVLLRNKK